METPVLRLTSPQFKSPYCPPPPPPPHPRTALARHAYEQLLNHDRRLRSQGRTWAPSKVVVGLFQTSPNKATAPWLAFQVWGPFNSPKTDLNQAIARERLTLIGKVPNISASICVSLPASRRMPLAVPRRCVRPTADLIREAVSPAWRAALMEHCAGSLCVGWGTGALGL